MKVKKIIAIISICFLSIILIGLAIVLIYTNNAIKSVKNIDVTLTNKEQNYSEIYDSKGNELKISENLKDNYISLNEIPEHTKQAFISIEDKNFYNHKGLNYKRIAKATYNNLKSKSMAEGASTITQQLVKNRFLTNEKTLNRKIKEAYLSKKLEKNESKEKILETYLNTIYFGNGAYGIGNASKTFFNKSPNELTLSESCVLAGCIKSPKNYSPLNNIDKCKERRNIVLGEMLKDNKITEVEYNSAIKEEIDTSNSNLKNSLDSLDLYSLSMIVDNKSHSVIAISGKSKYSLYNIKRQPGSLIKPILTFAPALDAGIINAKTQILDEPIDIDGYSPKNVGGNYYGYISVEDIVAKSLNIPTVKITEELGLTNCINYAKLCGIDFNEDKDNNLAVCLGGFTDGVTLHELTDSYSVLTNSGNYTKSKFINKIVNAQKKTVYTYKMSETKVYDTDTPYLMTDILKYSVNNGTSKKLSKFNFNIAGKTGTVAVKNTNYNTDAYSLAYTTNHTMSVWFGDYTMQEEFYLEGKNNGGTYCTQIICDMFDYLYKDKYPDNFTMPDTVEEIIIDSKSLDEDHIVLLGDNVPERYQEKCLVSKRFKDIESSTKFENIDAFDFEITTYKNSCEITFDAKEYLTYIIYRKNKNIITPLQKIKNKSDVFSYIDTTMEFNTEYTYYIEATNELSSVKYTTPSRKTKITKEYNNLISNNEVIKDNISWLFS